MKVLTIAAHPDDEVLGCGATMAKRAKAGDEVHILLLGRGATSRLCLDPEDHEAAKQALVLAAFQAAEALGAEHPVLEDLPDNRFDTLPLLSIVRAVEQALLRVRPEVVYTHHPGCLNVDHQLTARAVLTATRPRPGLPYDVRDVIACEVPSSTEWTFGAQAPLYAPTLFEDVTDTLDTKLRALGCYAAELQAFPHPRSLEAVTALARWRGATAGVAAAEAFVLLRGRR